MTVSKNERIEKSKGGWFDEPGEVTDDTLDDGYAPFWQFRIAIKPNQVTAINAVHTLSKLNQFVANKHPEWKVFIPDHANNLDTWDATLKGGDRDQRGKEICVYMEYQPAKNSRPEYYDGPYPKPEYLKQLMMDMWKSLQAAGVELAYVTPGPGEQEIVCTDGSLTPFSYSSFEHYKERNQFLESDQYNPTNQQDPLKNVQFTPEDLSIHGIHRLGRLTSAKRLAYQINHYKESMSAFQQTKPSESSYLHFLKLLDDSINELDIAEQSKKVKELVSAFNKTEIKFLGQRSELGGVFAKLKNSISKEHSNKEEINTLLSSIDQNIKSERSLVINDLKKIGLGKSELELEQLFDKNPDFAVAKYQIFVHLQHEKSAIKQEAARFSNFSAPKFPQRYTVLSQVDSLKDARNLLNDYIKGDSWLNRVVHLHWNRHHVKEVVSLVRKIDLGEIQNLDTLIEHMNKIPLKNPAGSLARRMELIVGRHVEELLNDKELTAEPETDICNGSRL